MQSDIKYIINPKKLVNLNQSYYGGIAEFMSHNKALKFKEVS
jgi:hypothetical protein